MTTFSSFQATVKNETGDNVPSATIEVRQEIPGLPLATVFSSAAGAAKANPFTADADGYFRFYAEGGFYRITATSGSDTMTWTDVPIGELASMDLDQLLALLPNIGEIIAVQETPVTIDVGAGGDFATLNEGLAYASTLIPKYDATTPVTVILNLLTGYEETEGVSIYGMNLKHVTIIAEDATVPVTVTGNLFEFNSTHAPKIACLFDMGGAGGHGIFCAQSDIHVGPETSGGSAGVTNAGKTAFFSIADNRFTLGDSNFSGAQEYGAFINHCSQGEIGDCDFSGAGQRGGNSDELGIPYNTIHVRHSSHVNLAGACNMQLGGSPSSNDIMVAYGGLVDINSLTTGGTSIPINLLTESGIIFNTDDDTDVFDVLSSGSLPAANQLTITDIPAWVKTVQIDVAGLSHNAGASRTVLVEVSTDNGANYQTTGYIHMARTNAPADFSGTDTLVLVAPPLAAADTWSGTITIEGIENGMYPIGRIAGSTGAGVIETGQGSYRGSNARINALRVRLNSTGSFDAGTYGARGFPH